MSGKLRARLDTACKASGLRLCDLTVLAGQNDPYRWDTAAGHRLGCWFKEQIDRAVPYGGVHLRALHYLLIGNALRPDGKPYVNDDQNWDLVQKAANAARWLGYVPFDRIRDERNADPEVYVPGHSIEIGFGNLSLYCSLDVPSLGSVLPHIWASAPEPLQPYRIIFIGEKSSLGSELWSLAEHIGAELLLPTGEISNTLIAGIAACAAADGRPAAVLYFSDFDPAGWQKPVSVSRKLQALRDLEHHDLEIEVHPVALTLDEIVAFGLPSTPLKETERRADRWQAIMGREQTEIDALIALRPGAVRSLAEQAIMPFYDPTLRQRARELAAAWEAQAWQELLSSENYPAACTAIEKALGGVVRCGRCAEKSASPGRGNAAAVRRAYFRSRTDHRGRCT